VDAGIKWPLPHHSLADQDDSSDHPGLELAGTLGEGVWAAGDGTVVFAGAADGGLGNTIVIRHVGGIQSVYAHLDEVRTTCLSEVTAGKVIGTLGQTGDAVKPFLYFEIRENDFPMNPQMYLP
jgi:murein DD-endopeptidase MepM/ murein hydrolase activator NlpD